MRNSIPLESRLATSRERFIILPQLTVTSPTLIPYFLAFFTKSKTSAFFNNALVGIQPQFRQIPPKWLASTIATFFPT